MTKDLNLPDIIYSDLIAVSQELTAMAKKTVSLPMTISILNAIYRAHIGEPCARDALCQRLANSKIMSPEEFDKCWNEPTKTIQTNPTKKTVEKQRSKQPTTNKKGQ
jgi:hypothetical protein